MIDQLYVRELSAESNGDTAGIGLADFCTRRLADAIDRDASYLNALTAAHPAVVRLPVVCANDRDAIRHALNAAGVPDAAHARIARVRDALPPATKCGLCGSKSHHGYHGLESKDEGSLPCGPNGAAHCCSILGFAGRITSKTDCRLCRDSARRLE